MLFCFSLLNIIIHLCKNHNLQFLLENFLKHILYTLLDKLKNETFQKVVLYININETI